MSDQAVFFVTLVALSIPMVAVMWKWKLYEVPPAREEASLSLMTPLIGFLLFLGACAFVPSWTVKIIHYLDTHGYSSFSQSEAFNFAQAMAIVVAFLLLLGFSRIHTIEIRKRIWGERSILGSILKGILFCVIAYPIVMAIVQTIHMMAEFFGARPIHDQVAISQLKALQSYPWLFWSFAAAIVFIVPIVEEFLFRGLLQNYFTNFCSPRVAIGLSSLIFAFFHYSPVQGATNIELLLGLFLYSFFIGTFYIRQASLWTPIAMHASFNALTIFILFFVIT